MPGEDNVRWSLLRQCFTLHYPLFVVWKANKVQLIWWKISFSSSCQTWIFVDENAMNDGKIIRPWSRLVTMTPVSSLTNEDKASWRLSTGEPIGSAKNHAKDIRVRMQWWWPPNQEWFRMTTRRSLAHAHTHTCIFLLSFLHLLHLSLTKYHFQEGSPGQQMVPK